MNKMQQSKGQKRTIVSLIIAILALTMFTVGMTFAYFTASSSATSDTMQFGTLVVDFEEIQNSQYKIGVVNEHNVTSPIIPGCTLNVTGTITTAGSTVDSLIRIKPTITVVGNDANLDVSDASNKLLGILIDSFEGGNSWLRPRDNSVPAQPVGDYLYYTNVVTAGSSVSFSNVNILIPADEVGNTWQGASFIVTVKVQAIQAEHVSVDLTNKTAQEIANVIAGARASGESLTAWAVGFPPVVSFNGNGASGSIASLTMTGNATIPADSTGFTTPSGEQFAGWATSPSGSVIDLETYTVTDDVTLYAIWEESPAFTIYDGITVTENGDWSGVITLGNTKSTAQEGDIIVFGEYRGNPMYWQVLDVDTTNNVALISSLFMLSPTRGDNGFTGVKTDAENGFFGMMSDQTYTGSDVQVYLNSKTNQGFLYGFTEQQRSMILGANVVSTGDNINNYNDPLRNNKTTFADNLDSTRNANTGSGDFVFALSKADVDDNTGYLTTGTDQVTFAEYFQGNAPLYKNSRVRYVLDSDGYVSSPWAWLLRTAYQNDSREYYVYTTGNICYSFEDYYYGVLPACFLKLTND